MQEHSEHSKTLFTDWHALKTQYGENYDLCEKEFLKLPKSEQAKFQNKSATIFDTVFSTTDPEKIVGEDS